MRWKSGVWLPQSHSEGINPKGATGKAFRAPPNPADSLHPLSRATAWVYPPGLRLSPHTRNERIPVQKIAEWRLSSFGDPDARRHRDPACAESIVPNPKAACRRGQVAAIVLVPRDPERLAESSRAACQFWTVLRPAQLDPSRRSHFRDSRERFQRAKQDGPCLTVRFAGHIQAIVIAVDEVDIGMAWWPEQYRIAQSAPCGGMCGRIILAEIGFQLNDAGCDAYTVFPPHQDFSEQLSCDPARVTCKKRAFQRLNQARIRWLAAKSALARYSALP